MNIAATDENISRQIFVQGYTKSTLRPQHLGIFSYCGYSETGADSQARQRGAAERPEIALPAEASRAIVVVGVQ